MIGNCLFGAIYAHLKDRKNTKILKLPASIMGNGIIPHYFCYNFTNDTITHFVRNESSKIKCNILFFGKFKTSSKQDFDFIVNNHIKKHVATYESKIRSMYQDTFTDRYIGWNDIDDRLPTYNDGLPFTKSFPYVEFYNIDDNNVPHKVFVAFDDDGTVKVPDNFYFWRYITKDSDPVMYLEYIANKKIK